MSSASIPRTALAAVAFALGCTVLAAQPLTETLVGREWVITWVHDTELPPNAAGEIAFKGDGTFRALGGCNAMSGRYDADSGEEVFTSTGFTRALCEKQLNAYDRKLFEALTNADNLKLRDDGILVVSKGEEPLVLLK